MSGQGDITGHQPEPSISPLSTTHHSPLTTHHSFFHLPREGLYWLAVAIVLLSIGLFKGINLLLLLACLMLALWGLNAILAGRRLGKLQGQRTIDGPVFALTPFAVRLQITNTRTSPVLGVRVDDGGADPQSGWFILQLGEQANVSFRREIVLTNRGRIAWGKLQVSSGYPFGLIRQGTVLAPGEEIIVLPALGRLHRGRLRHYLTPVGYYGAHASGAGRRRPSAQAEFHGLRTFQIGDSPRWIHWRTSARCGELMVREFEDVPNDNLVLLVDPELPVGGDPKALETILSLAGTICWEWCRQKGDHLMLIVAGAEPMVLEGITGPELALRMLESLAVQTGRAGPSADQLLNLLQAQPLPPAPLLLVSVASRGRGDLLAQQLNQAVASLDATTLAEVDFYEPPSAKPTA